MVDMDTARETTRPKSTDKIKITQAINAGLKRGMDITFSLLGLVLLWPFFLLVAVRIKKDDPGPAFYRGDRVGLHGKVFKILKFRTMFECPESYQGARITAKGDARVTPFGRWLRDTKLNELPQLLNVLVGDMSLVGPRPEDPEIIKSLPKDYREEILSVRPGITCPTSVAYHNEEHLLGTENVLGDYKNLLPDKMRMDRLYVRYHNIINDLDTIFWTFLILIPRIGKHKIQESWLYDGPITRFIRLYINWFVIDTFISLVGVVLVGLIWRSVKPLDIGVGRALLQGILLALSFSVSNTLLGLKTVSWQRAAAIDVFKLVSSCLLVATCFSTAQMLFPSLPGLSPSFIITSTVVVLIGFVVARYRMRLITGLATRWVNSRGASYGAGERVLIIGSGEGGEFATWMLKRPDFRPFYHVVGYVDDDPHKQGMRFDGVKVIGTTADIFDLVEKYKVGKLFFAIGKIKPQDKERILIACRKTNLPVVIIPEVIENIRRMFVDTVKSVGVRIISIEAEK
jgi:lipopolysaccharide/colanic/teichoic acid biosynthesis glycosyltransferase